MKKLYFKLAFVIAILPTLLVAQETVITLNSDYSGTSHDVIARNTIFLKPGFSYTPAGSDNLWAHIGIDTTLAPITAVACLNKSSFPVNHDPNLPVGTIPGQAGVSPIGAASYTIPIEVPPGTQGIQSNLSIVYNSQSGNGIMGVGWNLAGLSAITRVPKNIYNDGIVEEIKLDATDNFALDGQRLVLTNGNQGENGSEYHTKVETYVKVSAQEVFGNGPKWFKVETKDGLTIEFGNTEDSRVISGNNVLAWKINRIEDQYSNYMLFEYRTDDDEQPISKIKYTGNVTAGKDLYNTINFNYVERNDANTVWFAGKQINTNLLLEDIEIISEGLSVRQYEFTYDCSFASLLSVIKLTGSDGSELNVTQVEWDNGNDYVDAFYDTPNTYLENMGVGGNTTTYFPGDFDGDGISELFQVTFELEGEKKHFKNWKVFCKNSGNSSYTVTDNGTFTEGVYKIFVIDSDHDGKDEIFYTHQWTHYNEGQSNVYTDLRTAPVINGNWVLVSDMSIYEWFLDEDIYVGDFNGDGETDFYGSELVIDNEAASYAPGNLNDTKLLLDFNGNGKTDIMLVDDDGVLDCRILEYDETNNSYNVLYLDNFPTHDDKIFLGEFNGDGKTDILYYNSGWNLKFSTGSTFESVNHTLPLRDKNPYANNHNDMYYVIDFNNDGLSDILEAYNEVLYYMTDQYGQVWPIWRTIAKIHYNIGNANFISKKEYFPGRVFTNYEGNYFADFNGNGMIDIMFDYFFQYNNGWVWRTYDSAPFIFYSKPNNLTHLATEITNGLLQETSYSYKKHKLKNFNTSDAYYKFIEQPVFLATSYVTEANGLLVNQSFEFANPFVHKQGKGFLGFSDVEINDNITGFTRKSKYQMETSTFDICNSPLVLVIDTVYHPLLNESVTLDTNNDTISKITYHNRIDLTEPCLYLDYKTYNITPESRIEKDYLRNLTTTTSYDYDKYGNPEIITINYNGNATTQTINTYTNFDDWWCPKSRLQQSTVTNTRSGVPDFSASTDFAYNNNGALTSKISFSGLDKAVTETYEDFDNFGNPRTIAISSAGEQTRETLLEYNDGYGRFITKQTNPLGHAEEFSYDGSNGNLLAHTGANGLITSHSYDGFGRPETTTYPDGNTTNISRHWNISGNQLFYTKEITGGQPEKRAYFDVLARKCKTAQAGFDGDLVCSDIEYNTKGEHEKISEPYPENESASKHTVYEYYNNGRFKKTTYPTGATDTHSYTANSTQTTVTSSNGMWKTQKTDGTGALTMAEDAAGQITYTYYAHGAIKDITQGGNTISMAYDEYARQDTLTDPNAGIISYAYNAFGELTQQTDARGNTYNMEYDILGRLDVKKLGTTTVADYTYDNAPGKGIGLLSNLSGNDNISYSYEYDEVGRLEKQTENIQGQTFNTEHAYNAYSQLSQIKYPGTAYTVDNQYQNGYIRTVKGAYFTSDNIFTATGYNTRGQITNYNLGNGLATTKSYDSDGLLTGISTPGIQNLEYEFNAQTGNLNWREDAAKTIKEDFTYDALMKNRLETWKIGTNTNTATYFDNGNVNTKTGLGTFYYNGPQPHAVDSIDNTDNIISNTTQNLPIQRLTR